MKTTLDHQMETITPYTSKKNRPLYKLHKFVPFISIRLHLSSWKWRRLHPSSDVEPMKVEKSVAFTFNQSLYLFGGYGEYPRQPLGNDEFHLNHESSNLWPRGWFSSVFKFCTKTNCWMKITTKGESPSPRAGYTTNVQQTRQPKTLQNLIRSCWNSDPRLFHCLWRQRHEREAIQ